MIIAVGDLEIAAERFFRDHGLRAVTGGRHVGHGTGNRLIPLGGCYLELMTVLDAEEAETSVLGRRVLDWTAARDRPVALCLRTDDLAEICLERDLPPPTPMSRVGEDGTMLRWSLAGLEEMLGPEALPFFIEWDVAPGLHPAELDVDHPCGAVTIDHVELGGDAPRIDRWLGTADLSIEVKSGPAGVRAVVLDIAGTPVRID